MKTSSKKINKVLKYSSIFAGAFLALILCLYLPLKYINYEFELPRILVKLVEHSISREIGASHTQIGKISVSKKNNEEITIQIPEQSSSNKDSLISKVDNIIIQYKLNGIFQKNKLDFSIDKIFLNIDNFKLPKTSKHRFNIKNIEVFNKILSKKLNYNNHLIESAAINKLTLKEENSKDDFFVNYKSTTYSHTLLIKHNQNAQAFINIQASRNNKITSISAKSTNFPAWFFLGVSPKDYISSIEKSDVLHDSFNISFDYQFKNAKEPQLSLIVKNHSHSKSLFKNIDIDISNKNSSDLYFNRLVLETIDNGKISAKGKLLTKNTFLKKNLQIFGDIHISKLNMKYLGIFWPKNIRKDTREWVIKSFKKGLINKATCRFKIKDINNINNDNFDAYIDFDDLELDYYNDHTNLSHLSGTANFSLDDVFISVHKGRINNSKILPSSIQIEYGKKLAPLTLKTKATGSIRDFIHLISPSTKDKLIEKGINVNDASGHISANVFLSFPLAKTFNVQTSKLDVVSSIRDFRIRLYDKINLTNGEIHMKLNNKFFSFAGPIDINEQHSSFEWLSNFENKKEAFNTKFTIYSKINANSSFEEIMNNKLRILDGQALLNVIYFEKNNRENLQVNIDFDDAEFYIPSIGLQKKRHEVSTFTFDIFKEAHTNWKSKSLSLVSDKGINIHGNTEFSPDFHDLKSLMVNFEYPKTDLNLSISNSKDQKKIEISGSKIDLANAHISELFSNNNFAPNQQSKNEEKAQNTDLKINIDEAYMNNDVSFKNIKGEFICHKLHCKKSNLNININGGSNLNIYRKVDNKNKVFWHLNASDASLLFKGLGMYHDFIGGKLSIKAWNPKQGKAMFNTGNIFVGEFHLDNFEAIKNPIVTKLVSFTSLMGVLNIFTNMDKIPFKGLDGHFVMANEILRINRVNAYGSYLTLTMNGTVDWNYNDVAIYGKVVPPVYGFNYILSFIPFLGHQTAGGEGKGLIAANYSITGEIGNTNVRINPLSILFIDGLEFLFF